MVFILGPGDDPDERHVDVEKYEIVAKRKGEKVKQFIDSYSLILKYYNVGTGLCFGLSCVDILGGTAS